MTTVTFRKITGRWWRTIALALFSGAAAIILTSCAASLDMSGEPIDLPGPEWGIVIGSVLVRPEAATAGVNATGRDVSTESYSFDVVQTQPGDPLGENAYAQRYKLEAKGGEERLFVSRMRPGRYLIRNFREDRVTGLAGDLDLTFDAEPGVVSYIGRVVIDIPRRVARGKAYRFSVDNVRASTLAQLPPQHIHLAEAAVDRPLQALVTPPP